MQAEITRYALDRVPLSLIIDDSTVLLNLNYFWMRDRNRVDGQNRRWQDVPVVHPQAFTAEFANWCFENGVRGKFSVVPVPAAVGRIDRALPLITAWQQADWLSMCRDLIAPAFDITPEMLTHTVVLDPDTLLPLDDMPWEQYEWESLPEQNQELVHRMMRLACQILCDVGLPPDGVTSPGGFAGRSLPLYARLTGEVLRETTGNDCPYFFKRITDASCVDVPVWCKEPESGRAVGEIIAGTEDHTGGWEGYRQTNADYYITPDGAGGRLVELIREGQPAIMCSHWQGFYGMHNADRRGFQVLKQVVSRLRALDPDGELARWSKPSEITRYACARSMATWEVRENAIDLNTPLSVNELTLSVSLAKCPHHVLCDGVPLMMTTSARCLSSGAWFWDSDRMLIVIDAKAGAHQITID